MQLVLEAAKPPIDKILADGGSVILMSHLGRPKGKEAKYSLGHIRKKLPKFWDKRFLLPQIASEVKLRMRSKSFKPGQILLLENLRFYKKKKPEMSILQKNWLRLAIFT